MEIIVVLFVPAPVIWLAVLDSFFSAFEKLWIRRDPQQPAVRLLF